MLVVTMVLTLLLACSCCTLATAQVTFSRDWKAGKRSEVISAEDCHGHYPSTTSLCHMLINKLRASAACEAMSMLAHRDSDLMTRAHQPRDMYDTAASDKR